MRARSPLYGLHARIYSYRTSTSLRPLRWPNRTTPSTVANRVSSPPRRTLSPGWNLVPRWRTMIVPARTFVPVVTFTPRRRDAELRPCREHPVAVDHEHGRQLDLAGVAEQLDREVLAFLDAVLLATALDHCVHAARPQARQGRGRDPGTGSAYPTAHCSRDSSTRNPRP